MPYVQRKFYFPKDLYVALSLKAKAKKINITTMLRHYVERGLKEDRRKEKSAGIAALWNLVKLGEKANWSGPSDLSVNHDRYFVEAYEELKEGKKKRI